MTSAEIATGLDLSQWEIRNPVDKDQYYNCDAVIEAYVKGRQDGLKSEDKLIFKTFASNVEKSRNLTIGLLQQAQQSGFNPLGAYLRFHSFSEFQVLVPVPENDFVKDDFLKLYDQAGEIKKQNKDDFYDLSFSFMPADDNLSEDEIVHDGYIYQILKAANA